MAEVDHLLEVQALDLDIDQTTRQVENPAELVRFKEMQQAVRVSQAELDQIAQQRAAAEQEVEQAERAAAEIDRHVERLKQQLRNVVVVREAEALQHELHTLAARRSDLDDVGLAALAALESLDGREADLREQLPGQLTAEAEAATALDRVRTELNDRLAQLRQQRHLVASAVAEHVLSRYEAVRARMGGVAAAALEGSRCGGCHLDLARSELEELRLAPLGAVVECPHCGRMLVR